MALQMPTLTPSALQMPMNEKDATALQMPTLTPSALQMPMNGRMQWHYKCRHSTIGITNADERKM